MCRRIALAQLTRARMATERSALHPTVPRMIRFAAAALTVMGLAWPIPTAATPPSRIEMFVDCTASLPGDGTALQPFNSLTKAVQEARDRAKERHSVAINILSGSCSIQEPLEVDFPVEIRGSNEPVFDDEGWPDGTLRPGSETVLHLTECTVLAEGMLPVVLVRPTAARKLRGVSLTNLTLRGLAPCPVLQIQEVADFSVTDSIFKSDKLQQDDPSAQAGIDVVASRGVIARNYIEGMEACGICIGAGLPGSPADVAAIDNRVQGCSGGGMLLSGTSSPIGGSLNTLLKATVEHNDLSNNVGEIPGFGLRVLTIGRGQLETRGGVNATIFDNKIVNNRIGVMIDAGFPYRDQAGTCDTREFTGQLHLRLGGNTVAESLKTSAVVTFTRGQVLTNSNPQRRWQYLHEATFTIEDPDLTLQGSDSVFDHPLLDPFPAVGTIGICDADQTNEPLSNTLWYNGVEIEPSSL